VIFAIRAMTLSLLHLVVNWPIFTTDNGYECTELCHFAKLEFHL